MPPNLPDLLQKIKWTKSAQEVETWEHWWEMHEKISKPLKKTAKVIQAWWSFTGKPEPTEEEILDSLKRLVSGVLTHPLTIGSVFKNHFQIKDA